jgi:uncharacterized protein (DUF983 family)
MIHTTETEIANLRKAKTQAMAKLRKELSREGYCIGCSPSPRIAEREGYKKAEDHPTKKPVKAAPGHRYCGDCLTDKKDSKAKKEKERRYAGACPRCGEQTLFLARANVCLSKACIAALYRYQSKNGAAVPTQLEALSQVAGILLRGSLSVQHRATRKEMTARVPGSR